MSSWSVAATATSTNAAAAEAASFAEIDVLAEARLPAGQRRGHLPFGEIAFSNALRRLQCTASEADRGAGKQEGGAGGVFGHLQGVTWQSLTGRS